MLEIEIDNIPKYYKIFLSYTKLNHNIIDKIIEKILDQMNLWKYDPQKFKLIFDYPSIEKHINWVSKIDPKAEIKIGYVIGLDTDRVGLHDIYVVIDIIDNQRLKVVEAIIKNKDLKFCVSRLKEDYVNNRVKHSDKCYVGGMFDNGCCVCGIEKKSKLLANKLYNSDDIHHYYRTMIIEKDTICASGIDGKFSDDLVEHTYMEYILN